VKHEFALEYRARSEQTVVPQAGRVTGRLYSGLDGMRGDHSAACAYNHTPVAISWKDRGHFREWYGPNRIGRVAFLSKKATPSRTFGTIAFP